MAGGEPLRFGEDSFEILESITDAVFALDKKWRFTYLNSEAERVLFRSREELLGKNVWEEFPEAVGSTFYQEYHKAVKKRVTVQFEEYYPPLEAWFGVKAYPSEVGLLVYFHDVTKRKRAEKALRESEARYARITANAPGMVYQFVLRPDGSVGFPFVSEGSRELYGLEPRKIQQDPALVIDIIHPEDRPNFERSVEASAAALSPWEWEGRVTLRSGAKKWLRGTSRPQLQANGDVLWDGLLMDVTEHKRAKEALRESEQRLHAVLVQYASDVITVLEADGTIRYQSPAVERAMGYRPEELIGTKVFEHVHPEDVEQARRRFGKLLENLGSYGPVEVRFRHADGSWRYFEGICNNLLDDPSVRGIVVNSRDVTERVWAEEKVEQQAVLLEQTHDAVFTRRLDGRIIYCNEAAQRLYGWSKEEAIGQSSHDLLKTIHPFSLEELERKLQTEGHWEGELVHHARDSRRVIVESRHVLARSSRASEFVLETNQDVTERKRAEERLRQTETRYRTLVERMPAVVYTQEIGSLDSAMYMSPRIETLTGYSPEECKDPDLRWLMVHPDDRERMQSEDERSGEPGEVFTTEYRVLHRDGRTVWVRNESVMVEEEEADGSRYWQGFMIDITERKRAEEALRESEERFRQLFEQSVDAVFVHDEQGRFVDCNSRACLLLGYSREELLSLSVRDVSCNMLTKEEQARREKEGGTLWQRAMGGEPGTFVVSHEEMNRRKDGTTFPVEVRVGSVDYGGRQMMLVSTRDITERKEAEEALKESEERYRSLVEHSPETIAVHSEGRFVYVNPAGAKLFGATGPEELLGKPVMGFVHPDYREFARERVRRIQEQGMFAELAEEKLIGLDGRIIDVEIAGLSVSYGGKPATQVIIRDITERKRAEEKLEESEARFRSTFENASTGVALVGLDNRYLKVNRAFCEMLGYPEEELLGKSSLEITHPADREKSRDHTKRLLDGRAKTAGIEKRYVRKDGSVVWALSDVSLVRDTEGNPGHFVAQYQDITERKALEERLEYRAFHDLLTSLPNRALFLNRLKHALSRLGRREGKVAVLFVDLDNFKFVNDTLGHHVGDDLLVAVSARLRGCLRPEDTIARLGGDEFAVLLEDVEVAGKAAYVAERIVEELRMPFTLSDQEVFVTPSIGIVFSDPSHDLPEDLLRNADIAMYRAKEESKARYRMFAPSMESRVIERLRLENDLRRALERDEFRLHYQPVILLETEQIIGIEALVRWEHPERSLVTPDEFVPLAEEIGLIIPIGQRVLREACRQAKEWQLPGY